MARELSPTLAEAQKIGCVTWPYLVAKIKRRWGGVIRYDWESLYSGAEDDGKHTATMPGDGSLVRLRIANPATTKDLYYQRIVSPDEASDFSVWSDLSIANVEAVASASLGTTVSQFYVNTTGQLYQRISTDSGASWGAWSLIEDFWSVGASLLSAAYKSDGDCCVIFPSKYIRTEYDDAGDTSANDVEGTWYWGESFTPAATFILRRISLKLWRSALPCAATLYISAADGSGFPTGPTLAWSIIDLSGASTTTPGDWLNVEIAPISINLGTNYCFYMICQTGHVYWRGRATNVYPRGFMIGSANSGVDWFSGAPADSMFQMYALHSTEGNPVALLYRENNGKSWEVAPANTETTKPCTGLSIYHTDDWNIVYTFGAVGEEKGVAGCILGDGGDVTLDTWTAWTDILSRIISDPYSYSAPSIARPDTTRLFFCESFTDPTATNHIFYSHMTPISSFEDYAWLEPVPLEPQSIYGLCFSYSGNYVWLTNANTVYRASALEDELDISSKILVVDMRQQPDIRKGKLILTLDNTGGQFNAFDRIGDEITIGLGFVTPAGNEYSLASSFWITKYKLVSPTWSIWTSLYPTGILGTLEIEAEDLWDFLRRYKARRTLSWAVGTKTVKQLLTYFLARSGIGTDVISKSTAITTFEPEFSVNRGTSYRTIVKNLLNMVPDQLVFRESTAYIRNPLTSEAVDWIYHNEIGVGILTFRGKYGTSAWDPNRAEVWGTTVMETDAEFPQVYKSRDRLSRITSPDYPDSARAAERAAAELRKSEIMTGEDSWLFAMVNVGLEPWDKIQITDQAAGVAAILRRVIRIKTYWTKLTYQYTQILTLGAD